MSQLDILRSALTTTLGTALKTLVQDRGELTITVAAADYLQAALLLREHISPRDILGVAVIMGGILAVQLSRTVKPVLTQA